MADPNLITVGVALAIGFPLLIIALTFFLPIPGGPLLYRLSGMVFLLGIGIAALGVAMNAIGQAIAVGFLVFVAVLVGGGAKWVKVAFPAGGIMGVVSGLAAFLTS